jgi:hypothetical protein
VISVNVRSNTAAIVRDMQVQRLGKPDGVVARAQARALNRSMDEMRTFAGRKVREEYNVTLRGIRQASRIRRARPSSLFPKAVLYFSGKAVNLVEFGARAVNPWNVPGRRHSRRGGGVRVQVLKRGGRKLLEGAFLATLQAGQNAGKQGVFRRAGNARSPIKFLPSLSIPQMTARKAIAEAVMKVGDSRYQVNFRRELAYLLKGK